MQQLNETNYYRTPAHKPLDNLVNLFVFVCTLPALQLPSTPQKRCPSFIPLTYSYLTFPKSFHQHSFYGFIQILMPMISQQGFLAPLGLILVVIVFICLLVADKSPQRQLTRQSCINLISWPYQEH
uniref:Uncharacterized protein n=1 Tax=Glossina brevipalpis TaxID=37001 RepID=A0A1A9WV61_9MUSC